MRESTRHALGWGSAAGLGSGLLLLAHVILRTPSALLAASHPWRSALALLACGVVLVAAATLPVALLARLLPERLAARLTPPTVAVAAAVLPVAGCWLLFGLWPGRWNLAIGAAVILGLAAALVLISLTCAHWRSRVVESRAAALAVLPALAVLVLLRPAGIEPAAAPPANARAERETSLSALPAPAAGLVLLVTIDTLRADHLGLYGYPRLTSPTMDRLGAEGLVLRNLTAASSGTLPSVATLLTGLHPECHGVTHQRGAVPEALTVLAEHFARGGFRTFAVVGNSLLTASSGFASGFESFENLGDVPGAELAEAAAKQLGSGGEPVFGWVHFMDPHTPYVPPEGAFEDFLDDSLYSPRPLDRVDYGSFYGVKMSRTLSPVDAAQPPILGQIVARYDGEIRAVDAALSDLLDAAERRFAAEETVVLLTADHGETLFSGPLDPHFQHALDVYQSTVHVPGLLWAPGRVPAADDAHRVARHVDLLPTLLDAVGLPPAEFVHGASLLAPPTLEPTFAVTRTAWWDDLSLLLLGLEDREPTFAISDGEWKYIRRPRTEIDRVRGPRSWLHAWRSTISRQWRADALVDLRRPSGAPAGVAPARRLAAALDRHLADARVGCSPAGPIRDDAELDEKLRDLGYLD